MSIKNDMAPFSKITRRISDLFSLKSRSTFSSVDTRRSLNPTPSTDITGHLPHHALEPEKLGISSKHHEMFQGVHKTVEEYMSGSPFHASRNYKHIQRIVMLAHKIYHEHKNDHWILDVDPIIIYIACIVHEVSSSEYHIHEKNDERDQEDIIRDFLKANGCRDPLIYSGAAFVAVRTSYARELEDPEQIMADSNNYPALRIV